MGLGWVFIHLVIHSLHSYSLSIHSVPCSVLGKVVTMWKNADIVSTLEELSFDWGRAIHRKGFHCNRNKCQKSLARYLTSLVLKERILAVRSLSTERHPFL